MIVAENLRKVYDGGKTRALDGVSLGVSDGEFAVILGASGSGKSTLLNVLSGLERADEGRVLYDGVCISDMKDAKLTEFRRKTVGFVFQQYYLLPHLTAEGNVRLGAELSGNKDYGSMLEAVGLGDKRKAKPSQLSGGEQQRVCIARALAKNPRVLFLDEPTGALDEKTGREILDFIIGFGKSRGITVIMVTHNANIAETADTVIKMNSGKIVSSHRNENPSDVNGIGW